jgi:hypothetical protein
MDLDQPGGTADMMDLDYRGTGGQNNPCSLAVPLTPMDLDYRGTGGP